MVIWSKIFGRPVFIHSAVLLHFNFYDRALTNNFSNGLGDLSIVPLKVQCKPLNVITLGQLQSDNINRMITLTEDNIYQPYELYFKF